MSKQGRQVGGHYARKRFGQNFLQDPGVILNIVSAVAPQEGQRLVEIGPGMGAITRLLLEAAGELDVVELDRDLIPKLQASCGALGELRIHQADALKFDFGELAGGDGKLRIVGNLPYNISTPLLFHLFAFLPQIEDMHFMLQKEVVERLCADVGDNNYGRLSIMTRYYCEAENLFTVPPEAFQPAPKVDSAIVRLVPKPDSARQARDPAHLRELVTQAFNQRRKTLRNTLKGRISVPELESLDIDPGQRPQELSLANYTAISNFLINQTDNN